jgi:hypothetical protein
VSTGPIREPSFKSSSHYFFSGTLFDCSNQLFTFSRVCLILPLPTYQSFSHFSATRKIQNICRAESKVVYKMYLGLLSRITVGLFWNLFIYRCWIICLSTLKYILGNAAHLFVYSWRRLQFNWRMCPLKNNLNIPRWLKRKLNFWHWIIVLKACCGKI